MTRAFFGREVFVGVALLLLPCVPANAVSPPPVQAVNGMVVTSQRLASEVAVVLKAGGNAIDAAVAVGYALAVVHPCCGNIGGGGFATIHLADGRDVFPQFQGEGPARGERRDVPRRERRTDP